MEWDDYIECGVGGKLIRQDDTQQPKEAMKRKKEIKTSEESSIVMYI